MSSLLAAVPALLLAVGVAFGADAPRVSGFSPQGSVKQVRQVRAAFSEPMVAFGDPRGAGEPFAADCTEPGKGRWIDPRTWVYDFDRQLPGGVACSCRLKPGLRALSGREIGGKRDYRFSTGGPAILSSLPFEGHRSISEDQVFILTLDAAPDEIITIYDMGEDNGRLFIVMELLEGETPNKYLERPEAADLTLAYHGLGEADLESLFNTGSLVAPEHATLREVLTVLEQTYCRSIGSEYMHIADTAQKRWIQARLEGTRSTPHLTTPNKLRLLERLIAAAGFEEYLHTRYVGQKRFSLKGGESLIPLLDELVQSAGAHGVREVVVGMAHRGP